MRSNVQHYLNPTNNVLVHDRFQEISGAYVHNFTYKNFNPFLEGGPGGFIFSARSMTRRRSFRILAAARMSARYTGAASHTSLARALIFASSIEAS